MPVSERPTILGPASVLTVFKEPSSLLQTVQLLCAATLVCRRPKALVCVRRWLQDLRQPLQRLLAEIRSCMAVFLIMLNLVKLYIKNAHS